MNDPKQILVWRKDLRNTKGEKVRSGKVAAQLAHASLGAILNFGTIRENVSIGTEKQFSDNTASMYERVMIIPLDVDSPLDEWLSTRFTKVAVTVNSEEELLEIYQKALDNNVNVTLIQDCGLTEFGNVPTYTCLALGPDLPEVLDPIARHLPLL